MSPAPREVRLRDGRVATLRPVRPDDASGLVTMERKLAEDGRGMVVVPDQVRSEAAERAKIEEQRPADDDASCLVVAACGDEIAAHGALRQLTPRLCRHVGIFSLGVAPEAQGLGLGRALMEYLVDHALASGITRLELYTRADITRARALYESLGFVTEGVRRGFVRLDDGTLVDDLIMVRFA